MDGKRVAIAGFGSIGRLVGRLLDEGVEGFRLVAVSARDLAGARANAAHYRRPVAVVPLARIADEADVVVECTPAEVFVEAVTPAIERGLTVLTVSSAAILEHPEVIERARTTGARIVLCTASVVGFDAMRAAGIGTIHSVRMSTTKSPLSLVRSPWLKERGIDVARITGPTMVFEGTAREAARAFPANFNVAASVALAGIGPERTRIEIWLDPAAERNVHRIWVDADSTRFEMVMENLPNPGHEGTGPITAYSIVAALKDLTATLRVGT